MQQLHDLGSCDGDKTQRPQRSTIRLTNSGRNVMPAMRELIERIHASGQQLVIAATGGGSGAIASLLEVPGASAAVLEAIVPYAQTALHQWLGGPVEQACSDRTARAMAMAAFRRAQQLANANPHSLRGIGVTASLATTRPKRGTHRVHVAWQSADVTSVVSCDLEKGTRSRADDENTATRLVLDSVAEACGVADARLTDESQRIRLQQHQQQARTEWSELLLGERPFVFCAAGASTLNDSPQQEPAVLFPGAFDPLHRGHRRMAELAAGRLDKPVVFELSIANVDKPPLDFIEIASRIAGLDGQLVLLTRAATFVEKAELAPGCTFIAGADTIARISDPRYYFNDSRQRDAAIARLADLDCRFLVFGRVEGEAFRGLHDMNLPATLDALCDEVPESEFRDDTSSTQLREERAVEEQSRSGSEE